MKFVLHPEFVKILHAFWYRFRFLSIYILIGILSLLLELAIRSQLLFLGFHVYAATVLSLAISILFAFFGNTYFNFRIPPSRRNRALFYFIAISLFSWTLQWIFSQLIVQQIFSYEEGRLFISGFLFIAAYLLHRRFTFRDFKRVGVAIYANGVEDIKGIHKCIGEYPDFIHVDIVDHTFAQNAEEIKAYRMETVRALWPNKEVHTHIMSKTPSRWLPEVLPYSDLVYVHWECEEPLEMLLQSIHYANVLAGVALSMETSPDQAGPTIENADAVMLLTIQEPGKSGQKFDMEALERIEQLNKMPFRNKIRICVDGGVNEKIAPILQVEDLVSGSCVLNHSDPKRQIMNLQTVGRYELI
jgi:pentose-5-phosphate-3-epimerase/putative flippase GtrA